MKFKLIPSDYTSYICDKISRFKPAKIRFKTLFDDILNKFYLESDLSSLDDVERSNIAVKILNESFKKSEDDIKFKTLFLELEKKYFRTDINSALYLSYDIPYCSIIGSIQDDNKLPKNTLWLKNLLNNNSFDIYKLRNDLSLLYPLDGIILCEGQTEYTLLADILKLFNIDLNKIGYLVYPAGGKNQVARKYYELVEYLKLSIFILLDSDAVQVQKLIETKLRKTDKLYLIQSGEFEDLIPDELLLKTINFIHKNDYNCTKEDFNYDMPKSHILENIYKKYGYGEFKKAQFSKELDEYIIKNCSKADFSDSEINTIINELLT